MKYFVVLVMTLLLAVCGTLFAKGLLNKDAIMRLAGRGPETQDDEPVAVASVTGTVGEELESRAKQLDERAMRLDQEETRIKEEIRRFEDLRTEVENRLKEVRGELDSQDSQHQAQLKEFAEKVSSMKAKEAAALLETIETDELISVFNYIEPRVAGKILDEMDPAGKAGDLTKEIVGGIK